MKKHLIALAALAAMALALPAGASAGTGSDCSYASGALVNAGGVVVYTTGGSTSSSLVGVCVDQGPGGTLEAGNGSCGTYIVADGDNDNPAPGNGYMGLSNCETGAKDTSCDSADSGTGSNSGGCFGVKGVADVPLPSTVPTPICGNTSGPSWTNATRDGCQIP